jgi:hypothetical protein
MNHADFFRSLSEADPGARFDVQLNARNVLDVTFAPSGR